MCVAQFPVVAADSITLLALSLLSDCYYIFHPVCNQRESSLLELELPKFQQTTGLGLAEGNKQVPVEKFHTTLSAEFPSVQTGWLV